MNEPFIHTDSSFLTLESWQQQVPGLVAGFTTRNGGVSSAPYDSLNFGLHTKDVDSDVRKNREILAEKLDFPLAQWVIGEQVHGNQIKVVQKEDQGKGTLDLATALSGIDGLIVQDPNILGAAFFADCVPLFFLDPKQQIVGIAHAGWKGTVKNISGGMIEQLQACGSDMADILVAIGPSISGENYEVNDYVMRHIAPELQEKVAHQTGEDQYLLDLRQLNTEMLLQQGLKASQIAVTQHCTYREQDLFYSYRKDAGTTGRMLGYIGIRTE